MRPHFDFAKLHSWLWNQSVINQVLINIVIKPKLLCWLLFIISKPGLVTLLIMIHDLHDHNSDDRNDHCYHNSCYDDHDNDHHCYHDIKLSPGLNDIAPSLLCSLSARSSSSAPERWPSTPRWSWWWWWWCSSPSRWPASIPWQTFSKDSTSLLPFAMSVAFSGFYHYHHTVIIVFLVNLESSSS